MEMLSNQLKGASLSSPGIEQAAQAVAEGCRLGSSMSLCVFGANGDSSGTKPRWLTPRSGRKGRLDRMRALQLFNQLDIPTQALFHWQADVEREAVPRMAAFEDVGDDGTPAPKRALLRTSSEPKSLGQAPSLALLDRRGSEPSVAGMPRADGCASSRKDTPGRPPLSNCNSSRGACARRPPGVRANFLTTMVRRGRRVGAGC
jgi:hypothetical protein